MKTIAYRASATLLVILLGLGVFSLLVFAGSKSRGPLEDLASGVASKVAYLEKSMAGGDSRTGRAASLQWFDRYRTQTKLLNAPDTLLTGVYDNNTEESYESVTTLEDSLGMKLPIIHFYTAWGSRKDQGFPQLRAQTISDLGSVPMITWEPWLNDFDPAVYPVVGKPSQVNENGLKAIAAGKYDAYIDKWARDAKAFGKPFFLRFGHEMNDPYRYPWGPQNNKPADFIAAWRHVVTRFRLQGATNASWVWSPHPAYTTYREFYPGAAYVNWVGITTLNYGTVAPWSKWYTFDEIFGKAYAEFSLYGKPLMISEIGSLGVGGNKAQWFKDALASMPFKYPAVKAVVLFNNSNDVSTTYKALDWSITFDKPVLTAIREAVGGWHPATGSPAL
ncbi:hypothetical protein MUN81_13035 [Hymenobacter sp. 5317J-9]|uniref:glycoside hydrolase family 26 protein n=1 Tax=Hymenobacter sp. 5317J-9 TaxID=2932250 RepID=UPI001FD713E7|nr:glycosyl hydrolase [Hymenobacter sp. 5317J-9]UOQ96179.1 hypothetical protein MUN81_13035 [Hymenobacter sp. 5317J-9]